MKRQPSTPALPSHSLHTDRIFVCASSDLSRLQAAATMLGQCCHPPRCRLKPCSRRLMQLQNPLPAQKPCSHRDIWTIACLRQTAARFFPWFVSLSSVFSVDRSVYCPLFLSLFLQSVIFFVSLASKRWHPHPLVFRFHTLIQNRRENGHLL